MDSSVYVYVPDTLINKVCGLCGNYDGNPDNDMMTLEGKLNNDTAELAEAWADPNDNRQLAPVNDWKQHPCGLLLTDKVNYNMMNHFFFILGKFLLICLPLISFHLQ